VWAELHKDDPTHAACVYDWDSTVDRCGYLVFEPKHLRFNRGLVVHEVTHAAFCFLNHKVMTSEAVQKMSLDEQADYFNEALPRLVENLFNEVEALPDMPWNQVGGE